MNWQLHREMLSKGESVQFRPRGNSMKPKINSGDLVKVDPIKDYSTLKPEDIVFCKVKGNFYVHLITSIQNANGELIFQIGNNHGRINGKVNKNSIFGRVVEVDSSN